MLSDVVLLLLETTPFPTLHTCVTALVVTLVLPNVSTILEYQAASHRLVSSL